MLLSYWNENWKKILDASLLGIANRTVRLPSETETQISLDKLNSRGMIEAIDYGFKTVVLNGQLVWIYPITQAGGNLALHSENEPILRVKIINPTNGVKNFWLKDTYHTKNLWYEDISLDQNSEVVAILGGEPDFHSLAPFHPSMSPVNGEKFGIGDKQRILERFPKIKRLLVFPDCDVAGFKFAHNIQKAYLNSSVEVYVFELPYEFGSKKDVNEFYQEHQENFFADLQSLPILSIENIRKILNTHAPNEEQENLYKDWQETIILALGEPDKEQSNYSYYHCFNPSKHNHDDKTPSLSIHLDNDGDEWIIFCQQCYPSYSNNKQAWMDLALAKGLPSFEQFKAKKQSIQEFYEKFGSSIRSLKVVAREFKSHIMGERILNKSRSITSPFWDFHCWGGGFRTLMTGQTMMGIGSPASHKTNLGMLMCGELTNRGLSGVVWSPEWTLEGHIVRLAVRRGVIKDYEINIWSEWVNWHLGGEKGREPNLSYLGSIKERNSKIERMLEYLDNMSELNGDIMFLETAHGAKNIIKDMENAIDGQRSMGLDPFYFFLDYMQITGNGGENYLAYENALADVEIACREKDLWLHVTCQAKRGDSRATKDGEVLNEESGQGVSPQKPKVIWTSTPQYDEHGNLTKFLTIYGGKNNAGYKGYKLLNVEVDDNGGLAYTHDENDLLRFTGAINTYRNHNQ